MSLKSTKKMRAVRIATAALIAAFTAISTSCAAESTPVDGPGMQQPQWVSAPSHLLGFPNNRCAAPAHPGVVLIMPGHPLARSTAPLAVNHGFAMKHQAQGMPIQ